MVVWFRIITEVVAMIYYTVYDNKTDDVIAFGTAAECAQQLQLSSVDSFYCLVSRKRKKYTVVKDDFKTPQKIFEKSI